MPAAATPSFPRRHALVTTPLLATLSIYTAALGLYFVRGANALHLLLWVWSKSNFLPASKSNFLPPPPPCDVAGPPPAPPSRAFAVPRRASVLRRAPPARFKRVRSKIPKSGRRHRCCTRARVHAPPSFSLCLAPRSSRPAAPGHSPSAASNRFVPPGAPAPLAARCDQQCRTIFPLAVNRALPRGARHARAPGRERSCHSCTRRGAATEARCPRCWRS